MDEWQETQFSHRHIHNRASRHNHGKSRGKGNAPFDVNRTFGTYDIKCPAADKLSRGGPNKLDAYTLNEERNAVVGDLRLGSVLSGVVILTGSRKVMGKVIGGLKKERRENEEGDEEEDEEGTREGNGDEVGDEDERHGQTRSDARDGEQSQESTDDEEDDGDDDDDADNPANQRIQQFEKNSFRSPKFWMKWQGHVTTLTPTSTSTSQTSTPNPPKVVTDNGYIVFSGNQCDRFQGTISCEVLGWNNVKISGWKVKGQNARDFDLRGSWIGTGS